MRSVYHAHGCFQTLPSIYFSTFWRLWPCHAFGAHATAGRRNVTLKALNVRTDATPPPRREQNRVRRDARLVSETLPPPPRRILSRRHAPLPCAVPPRITRPRATQRVLLPHTRRRVPEQRKAHRLEGGHLCLRRHHGESVMRVPRGPSATAHLSSPSVAASVLSCTSTEARAHRACAPTRHSKGPTALAMLVHGALSRSTLHRRCTACAAAWTTSSPPAFGVAACALGSVVPSILLTRARRRPSRVDLPSRPLPPCSCHRWQRHRLRHQKLPLHPTSNAQPMTS